MTASPNALPTPNGVMTAPATKVVEAMTADLGQSHPVHLHFAGADRGGAMAFDVDSDGRGNLKGVYSRGAATGDVTLMGNHVYLRGAALAGNYVGQQLDPSVGARWLDLGDAFGTGFLGTVASSSMLRSCVTQYADQLALRGPADAAAEPAVAVASGRSTGEQVAEFDVATAGPPHLLRWVVLPAALFPFEPGDCNGGAASVGGDRGGNTGTLTLSQFDLPVTVVTPAGAVTPPNPDPFAR
jgi:hypothetical protein